jgi:hypothetical protein
MSIYLSFITDLRKKKYIYNTSTGKWFKLDSLKEISDIRFTYHTLSKPQYQKRTRRNKYLYRKFPTAKTSIQSQSKEKRKEKQIEEDIELINEEEKIKILLNKIGIPKDTLKTIIDEMKVEIEKGTESWSLTSFEPDSKVSKAESVKSIESEILNKLQNYFQLLKKSYQNTHSLLNNNCYYLNIVIDFKGKEKYSYSFWSNGKVPSSQVFYLAKQCPQKAKPFKLV